MAASPVRDDGDIGNLGDEMIPGGTKHGICDAGKIDGWLAVEVEIES